MIKLGNLKKESKLQGEAMAILFVPKKRSQGRISTGFSFTCMNMRTSLEKLSPSPVHISMSNIPISFFILSNLSVSITCSQREKVLLTLHYFECSFSIRKESSVHLSDVHSSCGARGRMFPLSRTPLASKKKFAAIVKEVKKKLDPTTLLTT